MDEAAILACAAYVDLNPIRAAMAETLEASDFTSVQRRIESLEQLIATQENTEPPAIEPPGQTQSIPSTMPGVPTPDRFLSPVTIDEQSDELGPVASTNGFRCSDKGYLPLRLPAYLELLDWTARSLATGKQGSTPEDALPLFARLRIEPKAWCHLVGEFGQLFHNVAGQPQTVDLTRTRVGSHRYYMRKPARELFATSGA